MRAPIVSLGHKLPLVVIAVLLIGALVQPAAAEEVNVAASRPSGSYGAVDEGLGAPEADDAPLLAASAAQLSEELPLQSLAEDEAGAVPLVAEALAGEPTRFVNQAVALDSSELVLGSFTVDGMTFAVTGDGEVELAAVGNRVLAGGLASELAGGPDAIGGEPSGASSGEADGERVIGASVAGLVALDGIGASGEAGASAVDGRPNASQPVALAIPDSIEHDGATYAVTSVGPRALVGCDADKVVIPATVEVVDEAAFRGSPVGSVEVAKSNPYLASHEGVLYDADLSSLLLIPEGKEGVVRIPSNTSAVAPGAFSHCALVTAVEVDAGNDSFSSRDGCLYDSDGVLLFESAFLELADGLGDGAAPLSDGLSRAGTAQASSTVIHASSQARCYWFSDTTGVNSIPSNATSFNGPYTANRTESFPSYYTLLSNGSWGGSRGSWTIFTSTNKKSTNWYSDAALTKAIPVGATMSSYTDVYPAGLKTWTVTFDKQGGTGGTSTASVIGGESVGTVTKPTLSGWTFRGYTDDLGASSYLFVKADGTGTTRTITANKTLLANWTKTVTLNANGGTAGSLASITAGIGRPLGQKCNQVASSSADYPIRSLFSKGITDDAGWAPTRPGYSFAGYWSTSASSGGTQWITAAGVGSTVTSSIPSTLYARWTPISYTATFDKKGGTGGADSKSVAYGSTVGSVSVPSLSGWTFRGYTDDLGTSTYLFVKADGSPTTRTWGYTTNKALLANWTKAVSLNANGGTAGTLTSLTAGIGRPLGQKCSQVASDHSDYPIRSLFSKGITDSSSWAPTRTGYAFAGYWSTSASSGGSQWITAAGAGSTVTSSIPSTLYARWTPLTYAVSFNANGGSGGQSANVTATYNAAMPAISTTKPTRAGYTFGGWYDTNATSGGTQYYSASCASARSWNKTANATLYARWTANKYTVSFNANGGSGGQSANVTATYDSAMPGISTTKPTRTGYTFGGWYDTSAPSGGTQYYSASCASARSWNKTANATLYARWMPLTYTVSFNANGGSGGQSANVTATYDSAMPAISTTKPTRTGYEFMGWYDTSAPNGGTQYYAASGASARSWNKAANATLYARWTASKYAVSFDANGGSGGQSADVTTTYDSAMPAISTAKPTRAGYAFTGWWDAADCSASGAKQYYTAAGASARAWDKARAATLYAGWEAIAYAISYDAAGGSLAQGARASYTVEDDAFDLPAPHRYGYAFMGWEVEGAQGAGVEDVAAADGSRATRVRAGTYGELACTARWALVTDVEVPVALDSVGFELGVPDGAVRVAGTADDPQDKAPGYLRSAMPVEVAVESVSCEAAGGASADPASPEGFWAGHAAFADLEVGAAESSGDIGESGLANAADDPQALAATGALTLTAGSSLAAPDVPSWLSIPAATGNPDGTLAQMGELKLLYGLSLDRLFADPASGGAGVDIMDLLPQATGSGFAVPTGLFRLVFTVDVAKYA